MHFKNGPHQEYAQSQQFQLKPKLPFPCAQVWQLPHPSPLYLLPAKGSTGGLGTAQHSLPQGDHYIHLPTLKVQVLVSLKPTALSGNGQIQTGSGHSLPPSLNSWRLNQPRATSTPHLLDQRSKKIICVTSNYSNKHTPQFWSVKGVHASTGKSLWTSFVTEEECQ